jgi:transcription initiation factor TFIIIB Brf1 subunit/transcription initiation factor TFIIB
MPHNNYKKVDTICPYCKSSKILMDLHRQETYCNNCGYILNDTSIFNILDVLSQEQAKNIRVNKFWRKVNGSFMGGKKHTRNKK